MFKIIYVPDTPENNKHRSIEELLLLMEKSQKFFVSIEELAAITHIKLKTLYNLHSQGKITGMKCGGLRFMLEKVLAQMERYANGNISAGANSMHRLRK